MSLENNFPEIPVTVQNIYGTFITATVKTSFGAGAPIQIILEIPQSSGRTIKEITRVAANTSVGSVQVTTGLYNTAPIPGNGNTVTFNTTLAEYYTKTNTAVASQLTATTAGSSTSFLPRAFYFMITLDNGQVIVPTHVRVYVDK